MDSHIEKGLEQPDTPRDTLWANRANDRLDSSCRGEDKVIALINRIDKFQAANSSAALNLTLPASDLAQAALAALSRAGLRAAEDALRANTHMVVWKNGKVLHESPQDYLRKRDELVPKSNPKPSA